MVSALIMIKTPVTDQTAWRFTANITSPTPMEINVICHSMKAETPRAVAAPFPPLKPKNGE